MPALQRRPTEREGEYNYLMLKFGTSMELNKNERSDIGKAQRLINNSFQFCKFGLIPVMDIFGLIPVLNFWSNSCHERIFGPIQSSRFDLYFSFWYFPLIQGLITLERFCSSRLLPSFILVILILFGQS